MDLSQYQRYENNKNYKTNENIWEYVKSRGERYAFETVQQDAVSGEKLNFNEISKNVERLSSILRELNLPSGIGICSENNLDFLWILLGILNAGIRCTLINPRYTARELRHFLELTKPGLIFCSKQTSEQIYETGESFGSVCSEYTNSFIESIYVWGTDKLNHADENKDKNSPFKLLSSIFYDDKYSATMTDVKKLKLNTEDLQTFDASREALILASSGSTGLPKGVILTHRNVIETLKLSYFFSQSKETALGLMPFFHAYGLILGLMCLCEGSKIVIVPKLLSPEYLSDVIDKYQINSLYIIPSLSTMIVKSPAFTKEKLSCVRNVWTSAGKVSHKIQERIIELIPSDAKLHHCFGMTETTFITFAGIYLKPESPGKILPNIECKIVMQEDNKICGPNEVGEICFKGPTIMKGYLNNENATKESLQDDGWLRSGDLGYRDTDNYFFIVDRIKDMIKYQGNQISPLEIEGLILGLPDVLEAVVVGYPDEDFGELPTAGIVVKKDSKLTEEEVKEHVSRQVSSCKKLRGGVFFLDKIPKTAAGKVRRKESLAQIIDIILCSSPQER